MKAEKIFSWIYIIVGLLTILEFLFVKGMFTWLIVVSLVAVSGIANVVIQFMKKEYDKACLFAVCSVALCMGYFTML